ncbi:MAG: hypothetical protein R3E42_13765 [Burkholderiaceae bacterium]
MNSTVFAPAALSPLALATRLALASVTLLGLTDAARAQSATTTTPATLEAVVVRAEAVSAPTEQSPAFGAPCPARPPAWTCACERHHSRSASPTGTQMQAFGLNEVRTLLSAVTGVHLQVEKVELRSPIFLPVALTSPAFRKTASSLPFASGLLSSSDMDTAIYDRVEVLRGANSLLSSTGNPRPRSTSCANARPPSSRPASA